MRFINLILSNFIGQLTTSMVEDMIIVLTKFRVDIKQCSTTSGKEWFCC